MRILHADDYPVWFERIGPSFEGHDYVTVESGGEALTILGAEFDVVITDYNMPGNTSGVDVALKALELGIENVCIFTSDPSSAERELGERGSVPIFTKGNNLAIVAWVESLIFKA
jgi:CheY-like chemotaxis protein